MSSTICVHERRKDRCKTCGGSGFCVHDKRKDECRECSPKAYCEHSGRRRECAECHPESVFKRYRRSAGIRGRSFKLTLEQFMALVALPCFYCGENTVPRGVDRWENAFDYTAENSRPCCSQCNYDKGPRDGAIWVDHCQRIAAYTQSVELSELVAITEQQ